MNIVTKDLFRKYRNAADYANAKPEVLEKDIQSTGFYRNKAKSIRAMAQALVEQHNGKVPDTMDELVDLAGVGRKTANVVLATRSARTSAWSSIRTSRALANRLKLTSQKSTR